jgi:hypothetical protein
MRALLKDTLRLSEPFKPGGLELGALIQAPHTAIRQGHLPRPRHLAAPDQAHNGIPSLDELPECERDVLEDLRRALEKSNSKRQFPGLLRFCRAGGARHTDQDA